MFAAQIRPALANVYIVYGPVPGPCKVLEPLSRPGTAGGTPDASLVLVDWRVVSLASPSAWICRAIWAGDGAQEVPPVTASRARVPAGAMAYRRRPPW